jgi:hypothetical protein
MVKKLTLMCGAVIGSEAVCIGLRRPDDHSPELGLHFDLGVDVRELGLTPSRWLVTMQATGVASGV